MLSIQSKRPIRGFTLVEMLVVIGIIAVLAALLMPAVMMAVNSARRTRIAVEIAALNDAVEKYKQKTGDYPPTLRDYNVFIRHVQRCYPKIDPTHLTAVANRIYSNSPGSNPPIIDEGEALVFWLAGTDNDPRQPFKAILGNPMVSPNKYFDFNEQRLVNGTASGSDNDGFPSYRAAFSKDTCYILIDWRAYSLHFVSSSGTPPAATAESGGCGSTRPYWSEDIADSSTGALKPANPTTFQIQCAGQDGTFGTDLSPLGAKRFPSGGRTDTSFIPSAGMGYTDGDRDNITNFSEGRRLEDKIPD